MKYDFQELFLVTTDTIIGLGGPMNEKNLQAIYKLKKRSITKKIIIMAHNLKSIYKAFPFLKTNKNFKMYAQKYFPGSTTLVVNDEFAFRIPKGIRLKHFFKKKGLCYVTSANISGQKNLSLQQAQKTFFQIKNIYDFHYKIKSHSTIIDIRNGKILRK